MSHTSKPVDWEVYCIPPIQPVQYYSILKKQREFSQLIKQNDAEVFRHGYLHYCGIVPKYLSSSLSNQCEIFIVLLDQSPTTSLLGFRVKVSKEAFTCESKSLLLFLKNCKKATSYKIKNNRIHVHCGTNAWELFYLIYEDFLRRSVLTIIGTQFFYHFVCSFCIEKEKKLLRLLYKKSKVIRVSKSSIYYKILRKRKISVTDFIQMNLNMPKRKKCILSCFNSRELLLQSDGRDIDFYTFAGNKIQVCKLITTKYKKEGIVSEKHDQKSIVAGATHKRKFGKIDTNENLDSNTLSKYSNTPSDSYAKNKWKQHQKFKSYAIKSYSSISFINPLVPNLLENRKSSNNLNLHSITHPNMCLSLSLSSDGEEVPFDNSGNSIQTPLQESKPFVLVNHSKCVIPKDFSAQFSSLPNKDRQNFSCTQDNSFVKKSCDIDTAHFPSNIKDINNDAAATEDVSFTSATGKAIIVSSAAMLKAYKLCVNDETLIEKNDRNILKDEETEKIGYFHSKKNVTKDISRPKSYENKYSQGFLSFPNSETVPKKFATTQHNNSLNTESLQLDYFSASENVSFSTAAGKMINISNTAMEAAQKLISKSTNEEKLLMHSKNLPVQRNQLYEKQINTIAHTSKTDEVDLNNTLVENFFEDIQFDEKELELTENIVKDNLNVIFESNNDKSVPTRKMRKSLGGRRSMRFCSDKL